MKKLDWKVLQARLVLGAGLLAVLAAMFAPNSPTGFLLALVPEEKRGTVGAVALAILFLQSRLPDVFKPAGIRRPVDAQTGADEAQDGKNEASGAEGTGTE